MVDFLRNKSLFPGRDACDDCVALYPRKTNNDNFILLLPWYALTVKLVIAVMSGINEIAMCEKSEKFQTKSKLCIIIERGENNTNSATYARRISLEWKLFVYFESNES